MSEILIYGGINSLTATEFINSMNEADGEITVRINTDGGEPEYGWGMVAKFKEFDGTKNVKVDGKAYSMGAFIAMYADNVTALDVSRFLIHRAAYSSWVEDFYFNPDSEYYNPGMLENVQSINSSLEKALRNKIDVKKFEELKGVKVKDIFSMEDRIDVFLTAQEAKKVGLISKIEKITPKKAAEINSVAKLAASYDGDITVEAPKSPNQKEDNPETNTNMTVKELKEKHPALYAQVFDSGVENGVEKESERVKAWGAWKEIDPEKAIAGIESGKEIKPSDISEFQVNALKAAQKKGVENDTPKDVTPSADGEGAKPELTAAQKAEKAANDALIEAGLRKPETK
jgi:ATP-dependent protease ClpP protease subunit